jgi:hypothetical protein
VDIWWVAPGIAVLAVSFSLTIAHLLLLIARRRLHRLQILALWLRQIGFGLFLLGFGARMLLSALGAGPDLGLLLLGALVAGFGGLFFIAASDPIFTQGRSLLEPWKTRAESQEQEPEERGGC